MAIQIDTYQSTPKDQWNREDKCPICISKLMNKNGRLKESVVTHSGKHPIHKKCAEIMLKHGTSCPVCLIPVKMNLFHRIVKEIKLISTDFLVGAIAGVLTVPVGAGIIESLRLLNIVLNKVFKMEDRYIQQKITINQVAYAILTGMVIGAGIGVYEGIKRRNLGQE